MSVPVPPGTRVPPSVPVRCRACHHHLADTDGRTLYLAACYFTIRTTMHCRRCGTRTVWSPPPKPNAS